MTATVVGPGGTVEIENEQGDPITVQVVGGLAPADYDEITLSPPSQPSTIQFFKANVLVGTITLTYDGDDIASVVRT